MVLPVIVLKNCKPELSFILIDLLNLCLKESCFPDCWKVSSVVPVFKNVGERSDPKKLSSSKLTFCGLARALKSFINDKLVRHLRECWSLF